MPSMKLNSTYEELKAYVQAQMRAMDCAIKECQPGSQISAALEEIAACSRLVFFARTLSISRWRTMAGPRLSATLRR